MAEAMAKALSDQQAQQAQAEAAQQQLEEKNRALMAEKDEALMKLAEIQKKMSEKQEVSGRCGSSSPDSSLGWPQSDLPSTMPQAQRLPPPEGHVPAASSSSGLGTTANTTTVGTCAGRLDLFSADGASTPPRSYSSESVYCGPQSSEAVYCGPQIRAAMIPGAHDGAPRAGCDSTSPPPRQSARNFARGAKDKKEAGAAAGESAAPPASSLNKLSELKGRDPDAPMATPRKDAPETSRRKKAGMPDEPSSTKAAAGPAAATKPDGTIVQDLDSQPAASIVQDLDSQPEASVASLPSAAGLSSGAAVATAGWVDELRNRQSNFIFPRHVVPPAAFANVRDVTRGQDSKRL
jgi:hypothetical protein